uniref:Myosin motor domain-containing protein n=1 Tax=Macrostomum lignano TaxID=282301 RepID=A0A1I8HDC3_9PLAT
MCHSLHRRYIRSQIYTWCGANTLVAVNPCQPLPELYTESVLNYCLTASQTQSLLTKQPPHVYGLAAVAYHNLLVNSSTSSCAGEGTNAQTLIVSGVSGSGKTESSKHLLRFLSHASSSLSCQQDCSQTEPIESVIEAVNPLLECFGNACTDENENSSRFGRHLELRFNRQGRLLGGQIRVLLLERGRALQPCADASQQQQLQHWRDRPFYSLLCCLYDTDFRADLNDENLDKRLSLIVDPGLHSGHRPLSPSHSWTKVAPLLNRFLSAATASREVARLLAGILLLARLPITTSSGARDSISDKLDENSPAEFLSESFADAEAAACSGLGLSEAGQLLACLAGARIESGRGSVFVRACTIRECAGRRDAVCRFLYGSLFAYLVGRINRCIQAGDANDATASSTIGILDLYGFENFLGRNGLDQLLINFANERLQQFYLNHFVLAAKQEYTAERLPWEGDIDPVEDEFNSLDSANSLVELYRPAERCLTALEELCRLNRPDRQLADRLNCSSSNGDFSIRHFAGKVAYSIQQFPAHNRDRCPPELVSLLREQTQSLMLREILTDSASNATVSSFVLAGAVKFRQDLARLIDRLRSTRPLWIRCLRPSLVRFDMMMETGAGWSDEDVAKQLESCGLLPATRAARRLHPVRLTYAEFLTRYGCLMLARRDPHPRPLNSPSPAEFELAYQRSTPSRTPERLLRRRTGASPADHQRRLAAGILTGRLAGKACPPVRFGRQFGRGKLQGRLLGGQIRVLLLERGRALQPCADASQQQQLQHWRDRPFYSLLCCLYDTDFRADLNDENLDKRLSLIVDPGLHSGHRPLSPSHSWTKVAPLLNRFLSAATASREVARLLAGILLLARLPITTSSGARDSISDKLDENSPAEFLSESFADAEAAACSGLGLSEAGQLLACLAGARIESGRGSVFVRACTIRECAGRRDAVCRFLYGSLFAYLVGRINRCIQAGDANDATASSTIGILDLYGFENFLGRNGLDQLLINFANERLQQFYLNHFVLAAKQEYTAERLPWEGDIDPVEDEFNSLDSANSLVELSVVTEAIGQAERCLTALEELCRLNRPDRQLADRLNCSSSNGDFSIRHFAGKVAYSIQQFPAHNRDRCPPEL